MEEHDKKWYETVEYVTNRLQGEMGEMAGLNLLPVSTLQNLCEYVCEGYILAGNTDAAEEWNAIVESCKMALHIEEEYGHPIDRNPSYNGLPSWVIDTIKG